MRLGYGDCILDLNMYRFVAKIDVDEPLGDDSKRNIISKDYLFCQHTYLPI